jgi:hypothetical protein
VLRENQFVLRENQFVLRENKFLLSVNLLSILLYVLNFTKSPQKQTGTIPNKGIKQVKSNQFPESLAGYN